jgi:Fe-S cluster assembly scaffold protein SufB
VHYVEGCSAPVYSTDSLHSAVVELIAKPGARIRYTTIQNWSPNVYNLVTKRAKAETEATVEWIDANIGCLASRARVITPSGPKVIADVRPGDQVQSWDPELGEFVFAEVTATRFSGYQRVHEIRSGVRSLYATSNHPIYSYRYDADRPKKLERYFLDYVRTDEVTQAIVPRSSVAFGTPHKVEFPSTTTEFESTNQWGRPFVARRARPSRLPGEAIETDDDLMWLFGLYVGDGSMETRYGVQGDNLRWAKVQFSVPESDRARSKLERIMSNLVPGMRPTRRADGRLIAWNSVDLANVFLHEGFRGMARSKQVPAWIETLPESQRLAFIAGCLDSDGCVVSAWRSFSIKSVSRDLLERLAWILTTLGIPARIHTEHHGPRRVQILDYESTSHGAHILVFPLDERLFAFLSDDLATKARGVEPASVRYHRKVARSQIVLPEAVEVRKVTVSEPSNAIVPTYDIEVAGTGNFVAEGFIVHNSKLTMKYPAVVMTGPKAHGEVLSVAYAGEGMHQDAGAKMTHAAPETSSIIDSKSISKDGGRTTYRGLVRVEEGAHHVKSHVRCDALILDEESRSDTYPYMEVEEKDARIGHEATVSKVGDDQIFYLMSRGLTEQQATAMIVNGFIEPIAKTLPMEYAVEMSRLIELNMEGAVG